jgi:MFS family permease
MISVPSFRRDFGYVFDDQAVLPAKWQAAFNNIGSIGQFFGGFLCSQVADKIGRKKSIAMGILICTCGIIGQIVTTSRGGFLGAKLVLGFGLGFYLTLGPLCCSEVRFIPLQIKRKPTYSF